MSDVAVLDDLVEDLCAKGRITGEDVLALRRSVFPDGVVDAAEAAAVFRLDHACKEKDATWTQFYVDALTDYFVWQSKPRGYVSEEQAQNLIAEITHDGHIDAQSELELLLNIVHWATSCPEALAVQALEAVRESVLAPAKAAYGSNRPPAVIAPADVEILRKVIHGPGSAGGFTVTRREAEVLFELNDATQEVENAPSWQDLFVKAIASHLMFPRGAPVIPDADEALRRETWLEERRGIGSLLMDVGRAVRRLDVPLGEAWKEVDPFGSEAAKAERAREEAQLQEAFTREAIDADEAAWLTSRVMSDGSLHDNERALLAFIKANSPQIDPSLAPLFEKAGI